MRIGFDNDKYLKIQSEHIKERIGQFGDKLYLEFGGKLFDDYHASRVLPGFQPDSKLQMLMQLSDVAEIVIVISAADIEKNKVRGDLGITYDVDVLRLISEFEKKGLYVGSVVITQFAGQSGAVQFRERLEKKNIKVYQHYIIEGYRGFLTIKLYGLSKWWIEQLNMLYKKYKIIGNRSIYASELEQVLFNLVSNILTYGTYGIIGLFVLKKVTDLEIGIQAIALSTSLFTAVKSIFTNIPQCAIFKVAKERVETITNCQEDNKKMISDSQVAVQNVSYSIGNKKILSGVNLRCKANELFIIKGCNGVGKSTLLKLITGLLPYNSGIVTIGNILPEDLADDNFPYKVLYLPQEDTSMSMTAMELYQIVIPSEIDRIDNLIGYWGLWKELLYEKKIEELSGGERKKIFLLLGYILEPEILLLDEPTNSLDIDSKNALLQYVKRRKGTTVIVTHETIFDAIADNIYYMEI